MEITYFFVFIAIMLACLLFFIRKTTSGSYLHGNKDDALDLKKLRASMIISLGVLLTGSGCRYTFPCFNDLQRTGNQWVLTVLNVALPVE